MILFFRLDTNSKYVYEETSFILHKMLKDIFIIVENNIEVFKLYELTTLNTAVGILFFQIYCIMNTNKSAHALRLVLFRYCLVHVD